MGVNISCESRTYFFGQRIMDWESMPEKPNLFYSLEGARFLNDGMQQTRDLYSR